MLGNLARLCGYGCVGCGKGLLNKKKPFCSLCEYYLSKNETYYNGDILSAISYCNREAKALIYYMKKYDDPYVFDYAAHLIEKKLRKENMLDKLSDFYITYAPRNPISRLTKRFDQSKEIADFLAIRLFDEDGRVLKLFKRFPFTDEQKKLGISGRSENASEIFYLNEKVELPEKVIIVDDVTTTGATLHALRDILLDAGVKECLLFSVAVQDKNYDI